MTKKTECRICEHCGAEFFAESYRIRKGLAKFCSQVCGARARKPKHGHTTHTSHSRTYSTYMSMISRCHRVGSTKYERYGAVGIHVCERWRESFEHFLEDMGERPDGMTIDRIDGKLGYFKENCRWATPATQQHNIKTNVHITYAGVTKTVTEWSKELGIETLSWRLRHGWSIEDAFNTTPKLGNRVNRTSQKLYTFEGRSQNLSEWSREYGISLSLLRLRIDKGWDIEKALKTPKGHFVRKGDVVGKPCKQTSTSI